MSIRSTIVMAVIVAVLGWLYVYQDKVKAPDIDPEHPPMFSFKPEDVIGIDLSFNGKKLNAIKKSGVWIATVPYQGLVVTRDMQNFVNQLSEMKAERIVQEDVAKSAFKQFGLDKPTFTAKLHLKSSKDTPTLTFGSHAPSDGPEWYARVGDESKVVLAGNTIAAQLVKMPEAWREKGPLPADAATIDRIVASGQGTNLELNKVKETEEWAMEKPHKGKSDPQSITSWIARWAGTQIANYEKSIKADDPRLSPTYTLKVWNKGERDPMTLIVGQPTAGGNYAMRTVAGNTEVFVLPATWQRNLTINPADLADKHLADFDMEKAAKVEITQREAGKATGEKVNGTWEFKTPVAKNDEMGKLTGLLYILKGLKFERRVTDPTELATAQKSLQKPFATFVVMDEKGKKLASVAVGNLAPQNRRYVQGLGKDVYVADGNFANAWKDNIMALKSPAASPGVAAASPGAASSPDVAASPDVAPSPAASGAPNE